ncbi:hypothetical protein SPBR_03369 [Sporothrix brasiliensis 5110]|uniref:Secreted protein n=1 Tax=Sporothrix brasiliensis 5110 TaxID=1398154 RepID=A0A0C2FP13_9PEZI|nr:uncharacterized protein SPBR_03369 [Sporothrix brasiliensis 5110]KIH92783.1 hypothetical protein SPBR_03369 [Sporothrix brasiliensis 5110]
MGCALNQPMVGLPTLLAVNATSASSIVLACPWDAASASSCMWQHLSSDANQKTAASTVGPTVSSPWFWSRQALPATSARAMLAPSAASSTTPLNCR